MRESVLPVGGLALTLGVYTATMYATDCTSGTPTIDEERANEQTAAAAAAQNRLA